MQTTNCFSCFSEKWHFLGNFCPVVERLPVFGVFVALFFGSSRSGRTRKPCSQQPPQPDHFPSPPAECPTGLELRILNEIEGNLDLNMIETSWNYKDTVVFGKLEASLSDVCTVYRYIRCIYALQQFTVSYNITIIQFNYSFIFNNILSSNIFQPRRYLQIIQLLAHVSQVHLSPILAYPPSRRGCSCEMYPGELKKMLLCYKSLTKLGSCLSCSCLEQIMVNSNPLLSQWINNSNFCDVVSAEICQE